MTVMKPRILAYGLYDWAQSPLPTIHTTFIFAVYFATAVMPEGGTVAWAWLNAGTAITIAITAPLLGVLADQLNWRKTFLSIATMISIIALGLLWFVTPEASAIPLAIGLSALVMIFGELAFVFYNALLPAVTTTPNLGRVSGLSWGMGYFGAIFCLVLVMVVFIFPDTPPFGLDKMLAEPVRATMVLAAVWFAVFAWPLFVLVPEGADRQGSSAQTPRGHFWADFREGWQITTRTPGLLRFLVARLLYADGLVTLFAMGGIFAARVHGFSQQDVIIFPLFSISRQGLVLWRGAGQMIGRAASPPLKAV